MLRCHTPRHTRWQPLQSQQDRILNLTLIKLDTNTGYFRPCSWEAAVIRLIQS